MAHQHSPRFLQIVLDAKRRVHEVSIDDVKGQLDRGEKLLLIDVREESEYAKDHLPGAIHLGKGVIERDIEEHVPDLTTPMVLYCGGGYRSALTADNLSAAGGKRACRCLRTEFGTCTKYLGNLVRLSCAPQHGIRCRR